MSTHEERKALIEDHAHKLMELAKENNEVMIFAYAVRLEGYAAGITLAYQGEKTQIALLTSELISDLEGEGHGQPTRS